MTSRAHRNQVYEYLDAQYVKSDTVNPTVDLILLARDFDASEQTKAMYYQWRAAKVRG